MLKDKSGNVSKNSGVLTYETKHLKKEYGESQRKEGHYAAVDISYPVVTAGNNACKNSVNTYIQNYLIQKLRDYLPRNTAEENDIGTLAQSFLNGYKAFVKEFPESHQRWFITINGEVIYNTPAITTLTLSINTYTGGAHGNSGLTYVSFDAATGEKITLTNIITDEKKLVERSEKKFRTIKRLDSDDDLRKAGFWFEGNTFSLPDNFGITGEGLVFYYNNYEIASYAMGPTKLVLSYNELKNILRKELFSH